MVDYPQTLSGPSDVFGALSDPTRLAIVARLANEDATINELAGPFAMSLQAVSKHVRVLERAGLVQRRKIGRSYHCRLNHSRVLDAKNVLSGIEAAWLDRLDRLADYLDDTKD
jgi:DNA-binding transcriptional ArsR family regulator